MKPIPTTEATEVIDFLYKHGDLTYSAAWSAVRLLTGNGYGFTRASSSADAQPASTALVERLTKALETIAEYPDHQAGACPKIARSALSASQSTSREGESRG